MSNGQPGVGQTFGGTGFAANEMEIYQKGNLEGSLGLTPIGADGRVYLGPSYDQPARQEMVSIPKRGQMQREIPARQTTFTTDQAELMYVTFDDEQMTEWEQLTEAVVGYVPAPNYQQSLWRDAVQYVAAYQKATGELMTPQDYMRRLGARAAARGDRGGAYTGPVTTVSRSRDVNLSNPSEARALLDNFLGEYLGRLPSEDEYRNFTKALNIQERGAPQITEATTTVTPQGQARRTQVSESEQRGGFVPEQFAREFARGQEGAAETAVGGPLLNAFLGLLRGGNR